VRSPLPGQAQAHWAVSLSGSLSPASRSSQFHCQRQPDSAESGRAARSLSRFPRQADRRAISESESQFSDRHPSRLRQPSQLQRPAFTPAVSVAEAGIHPSRLSCRGRHSPPAVSVAEAGIHHQPSQLQRPAFTSRLSSASQPSQFQRSASPAIQGSDRHRQPDVSVSERPRSAATSGSSYLSSYLPSAGAGARQRARLRLRCPEARRHQPTIIDQPHRDASMRA
jgi:hypothetical protein